MLSMVLAAQFDFKAKTAKVAWCFPALAALAKNCRLDAPNGCMIIKIFSCKLLLSRNVWINTVRGSNGGCLWLF